MSLPHLYRSFPNPAQAKSLVAEASSLSVSALADLCEEHNLTTKSAYFRSCSLLLAQFEDVASHKIVFLQKHEIRKIHYTKRHVAIPDVRLPYPTNAVVYFCVQFNIKSFNFVMFVRNGNNILCGKDYRRERLSFRDFGSSRLQFARMVIDFLVALEIKFEPVPFPDVQEPKPSQSSLFD